MRAKEYLLLKNKNICKLELTSLNSSEFLDILVSKINDSFNFFVVSFDGLSDSAAFSVLARARQLVAEYNALFVVSARVDFALALQSDGIFLDENCLPFKYFKESFSDEFIVAAPVGSSIEADIYIE